MTSSQSLMKCSLQALALLIIPKNSTQFNRSMSTWYFLATSTSAWLPSQRWGRGQLSPPPSPKLSLSQVRWGQPNQLSFFPGGKDVWIGYPSGWRIGWAISPPAICQAIDRIHCKMVDCPPSPFQFAALQALQADPLHFSHLQEVLPRLNSFLHCEGVFVPYVCFSCISSALMGPWLPELQQETDISLSSSQLCWISSVEPPRRRDVCLC